MLSLLFVLFLSGTLTILLPCILPLLPIVLGTSIAGRHPLRPLMVVLGMLLSFVAFTFLLNVTLSAFPEIADNVRIATYDVLLLFGAGFLTENRWVQYAAALLGALFFLPALPSVIIAAFGGLLAVHLGPWIVARLQSFGGSAQQELQQSYGADHPLGAFLIGATLGLVWVPCAGPALGFVFTLLITRPGSEALILLTAYGAGTAIPLLLIGYGGQLASHSVRAFTKYSHRVKQIAGVLLIFSAIALRYDFFLDFQTFLVQHTNFGTFGTQLEERLFEGVNSNAGQ